MTPKGSQSVFHQAFYIMPSSRKIVGCSLMAYIKATRELRVIFYYETTSIPGVYFRPVYPL